MQIRSFVLIAVLAWTGQSFAVPVQWLPSEGGNGHFYDWISGYHTWSAARDAAAASTYQGVAGHLATLSTELENEFFETHFSQATGSTMIGWLGGYQDITAPDYFEPGAGWRWITGEPWTFTKWWTDKNEPDNFRGSQEYLRTQPVNTDIFWDDLEPNPGGSYIGGYFIEYPVPEPTSLLAIGACLGLLRPRRRVA